MSERVHDGYRLCVGQVPGVTTTKWQRIWADRFPKITLEIVDVAEADQRTGLDHGHLDLCFVRLPVERDGIHLIPLYEEVAVVVGRKDHPIAVFDEVELAELADENVIEADHPDAIDLVAGGAGVMFVPQSIARAQSRRDLVHRPVVGLPPTRVGLAWRVGDDNPLVEDFIGIVRGRTANSSRSRTPDPSATGPHEDAPSTTAPRKAAPKKSASSQPKKASSANTSGRAEITGRIHRTPRRPPKKRR